MESSASHFWDHMRVPLAGMLALLVVLAGIFSVLAVKSVGRLTEDTSAYTEVQKLDLLASLAGTSSVSEKEKGKTLTSISSPSKKSPSEQEKMELLKSLQSR